MGKSETTQPFSAEAEEAKDLKEKTQERVFWTPWSFCFFSRIRKPLKSGCFEDPQTPLRDTGSFTPPLQGPWGFLGLLIFLVQSTKLNYDCGYHTLIPLGKLRSLY